MIDRLVDRALHTVAVRGPYRPSPRALELHRREPVVDLLAGTVLFRRTIAAPLRHGHVDLDRLAAGGVRLVGLSIATRFPDLRGTLSTPHFLALGVPPSALGSDVAIMRFLVGRIDAWAASSGGRLVVVREAPDLDVVCAPGGPIGAFIGVQGAHALGGSTSGVGLLHALGVRMLSLAHVMDNAAAGSGTGRRAGGLTPFGRAAIEAMERAGIIVDLAHASSTTIRESVPILRRPFVLSHTGFVERAAAASRWRRYSAANRNVAMRDARLVAEAGGVVGVTYAVQLLGGSTVAGLVDTIRFAADELGPRRVALGSDLDGALRAVIDASGTPLVTEGLLRSGMPEEDVVAILGGNALRVLRAVLPAGRDRS